MAADDDSEEEVPGAPAAGGEEDDSDPEAAERARNYEYIKWRRDFDHMKRQHKGVLAQSDKLRAQGNQFFSLGCYMQAAMVYSEAIELRPDHAVLYCNRSMAYLKQDMPHEALSDAEESLRLDSTVENIKGYWRKAQALLDLGRLEDSEAAAGEGMALQAGNMPLNRVRRKAREALSMKRIVGEWVGQAQPGVEKRLKFGEDGALTITVFGKSIEATFDLSVECNPQVMHLRMSPDGSGPPPPALPYIFEFHEDELWTCHPVGTNELPTTFSGPGFDRLRRGEAEPAATEETDDAEPLDERCVCYIRELNEAMPQLPPQLPARPSEQEVSDEALLMERLTKLRRRFGHRTHARALELALRPRSVDGELAEQALQLQSRLLARRIISQEAVDKAAAEAETVEGEEEIPGHIPEHLDPNLARTRKVNCLVGLISLLCSR